MTKNNIPLKGFNKYKLLQKNSLDIDKAHDDINGIYKASDYAEMRLQQLYRDIPSIKEKNIHILNIASGFSDFTQQLINNLSEHQTMTCVDSKEVLQHLSNNVIKIEGAFPFNLQNIESVMPEDGYDICLLNNALSLMLEDKISLTWIIDSLSLLVKLNGWIYMDGVKNLSYLMRFLQTTEGEIFHKNSAHKDKPIQKPNYRNFLKETKLTNSSIQFILMRFYENGLNAYLTFPDGNNSYWNTTRVTIAANRLQ